MIDSPTYTVLLYYKYVHIPDPTTLMISQRALCQKLNLKGRIIIASEGINGTIEGTGATVDAYIHTMRQDPKLAALLGDIHFKKSTGTADGTAFKKLMVKVRPEIVSGHLTENDPIIGDVNPTRVTGKRLSPEILRQWFANGKEFAIVDMRNSYEHSSGYFRGSILPALNHFRDLPKVTTELEEKGLKTQTVLTVCTGGVRCEKASGYLVKKGFEDVYQLDGGIVSYMEKYPGQDFLGSLYVFDNRLTMNFVKENDVRRTVIGKCSLCDNQSENYVNCGDNKCHEHFICCVDCVEKTENNVLCPKH